MIDVTTNGHERELVSLSDLPEDDQSDFYYLKLHEFEDLRFVRYKNSWYDVNDMMHVGNAMTDMYPEFAGWHGYDGDTAFSGVLVRFCEDTDYVVMGRYYAH